MMNFSGLSDAHAVLLAVQLCVNGDISPLPALRAQFPRTLTLDLLLRIILTFLPESISPARYTSVIQLLVDGSLPPPSAEVDVDTSIEELSATDARKQARRLRLLPLRCPALQDDGHSDSLTQFLIHRAHRIDTESGIQPHILELLEPFISSSDVIRTLAISTVLPLLRFNYEYHPNKDETLPLQLVQSLDSRTAVNLLLSKSERRENGGDVARDLRGLIGPWMHGHVRSKRRKLSQENAQHLGLEASFKTSSRRQGVDSGWQDVNEWLLSLSLRDFTLLVEAIENWEGPEDIDVGGYDILEKPVSMEEQDRLRLGYAQAALASIYAVADASNNAWSCCCRILSRIASLCGFHILSSLDRSCNDDPSSLKFNHSAFPNASRGFLLHSALLDPSNPFTIPSAQSVAFLDAVLLSVRTLNDLGHSISPRAVAELCLFADEEAQLTEFQGLLETMTHGVKQTRDWQLARQQLLWLRDWIASQEPSKEQPSGIFWQIPLHRFERETLKAMLSAKQYVLAVSIYAANANALPLPPAQVEAGVTESIFIAYDNATNGNKTRGGIKKASEMLKSFSPYFPESESFRQIESLIAATHALSFYSLTLQHGVPFQPVSIRIHHDPLSLIEKVLEQNAKAYTQLDNLLVIARHFVAAGLPCVNTQNSKAPSKEQSSLSPEQITQIAERRIISLAVSSALQANDFDTAYSYVLTHLTPPSLLSAPSSSNPMPDDQISWRAAYNAGKHPSTIPEHAPRTLQSQLTHLARRMELLSVALILSPSPEHLPEILAVWRRCEEELSILQAEESAEAEEWDTYGDQARMSNATATVPGGFGPSDRELDALETERKHVQRSQHHRVRRNAAYEQAPMGLFDVARGAARAIGKTAFPLRSAAANAAVASSSAKPLTASDAGGSDSGGGRSSMDTTEREAETRGSTDGGSRMRKRDMVSSMVTGGLVTGIGWVLGAQPVNHQRQGDA
ncbi:hypothetical protein VTO42DRAFT_29 [Malbranchea cinnamomea]